MPGTRLTHAAARAFTRDRAIRAATLASGPVGWTMRAAEGLNADMVRRAAADRIPGPVLDKLVLATLPYVPGPVMRRLASRYIAGETLDEALAKLAELQRAGHPGMLDILGENIAN